MLIYRRTSLLESTAQTLVNTVNCVGVMGKGIALQFKAREPHMFAAYKRLCDEKKLAPGKLWLWRGSDSWTLNFPTKVHWRNPSKLEWIEAGLAKFASTFAKFGIREVSFPRLGCGNGGLDWEDVRPLMERYLLPLPIEIYIHDYAIDIGLPEHLEAVSSQLKEEQSRDPTFSAFIDSLRRVLELSNNTLVDLMSKEIIQARLEGEELVVSIQNESWEFDLEALRGVWISLQKGLLTKEKAGWSIAGGGQALLSIISVLPQFRPVEIQRAQKKSPELAVEQRTTGSAVVPSADDQREFIWH